MQRYTKKVTYAQIFKKAVGSEELRVKNEESAGAAAGSEELRMKSEESAGAAMAEAPE